MKIQLQTTAKKYNKKMLKPCMSVYLKYQVKWTNSKKK